MKPTATGMRICWPPTARCRVKSWAGHKDERFQSFRVKRVQIRQLRFAPPLIDGVHTATLSHPFFDEMKI